MKELVGGNQFRSRINISRKELAEYAKLDNPIPKGFQEVYLRTYAPKDAQKLADLFERNKDNRFFAASPRLQNAADDERYEAALEVINEYQTKFDNKQAAHYAIVLNQNNEEKMIGFLQLTKIDYLLQAIDESGEPIEQRERGWNYAIMIDQKPEDGVSFGVRGISMAAMRALMEEAARAGANRICSFIHVENIPSLRFAEKSVKCVPLQGVKQIRTPDTTPVEIDRANWKFVAADVRDVLKNMKSFMKSYQNTQKAVKKDLVLDGNLTGLIDMTEKKACAKKDGAFTYNFVTPVGGLVGLFQMQERSTAGKGKKALSENRPNRLSLRAAKARRLARVG